MSQWIPSCVCNRAITSEPYYGLLGIEMEEIVYFDGGHVVCLSEWGLELDGGPLGVAHLHVE